MFSYSYIICIYIYIKIKYRRNNQIFYEYMKYVRKELLSYDKYYIDKQSQFNHIHTPHIPDHIKNFYTVCCNTISYIFSPCRVTRIYIDIYSDVFNLC